MSSLIKPYKFYYNNILNKFKHELTYDEYRTIINYNYFLCIPDDYLNVNCKDCKRCWGCVNCDNCTSCEHCIGCVNCKYCYECKYCIKFKYQYKLSNDKCYYDLTKIKKFVLVDDNENINCIKCENCKNCIECDNCKDCESCQYCKNCENCIDCKHSENYENFDQRKFYLY